MWGQPALGCPGERGSPPEVTSAKLRDLGADLQVLLRGMAEGDYVHAILVGMLD